MKKLLALVLALVCVLGLVGCNNAESNEVMEDFTGIVTDVNDDTGYLVEVTDSGSSTLKVGDRVIVLIPDGSNVEHSVDDYIKVEFNGVEKVGRVHTTAGRIIINQIIPQDLGYVDRTQEENIFKYEIDKAIGKSELGDIVGRIYEKHGTTETAKILS